jgi:transcriptional regulator with XRE-family HTH domain
LRAVRRERGWTQEQLSERAGVHRVYIAKLEAQRQSPSLEVLEKLARALNVKPAQLLD